MSNQRYFSNIYWHFTGSPKGIDWKKVRRPADIEQQGPVLDPAEAAATLEKILESKLIWARCTEKILDGLETDPFCCVTDIPLKDLPSHAPYYGKVAIGFKSEAIHKYFIPVLYIPKASLPVAEKLVPNQDLVDLANRNLENQTGFSLQQYFKLMSQARAPANKKVVLEGNVESVKGFFMNFIKITDFDSDPQNTFYREREWRSIGDFKFDADAVAAVVAPEAHLGVIADCLKKLGFSSAVSLVAWEFIERA